MSNYKTRIEIMHKYNPNYVPEFTSLCQDDDQAYLEKIYVAALEKVAQENKCHYKEMVDVIFPFFDVIDGKEKTMMTYLVFLCLKSLITEHQDILEKITPQRNELEERCYNICQKILSLHAQKEVSYQDIFPLFKEYIFLFIEGEQGKITLPSFDDPSRIVLGTFKDFLPYESLCCIS